VSLYDEVAATPANDVTCTVTGAVARQVGPMEQNLAYRAARLLRTELGVREGVHLSLTKRIPVAGGMAGGSADGAAALLACARLWDLRLAQEDLYDLAASLGADVPFALMGGCAVGLGRGERLTPALSRGTYHWVLAIANQGMSTPAVFARFDELNPGPVPAPVVPPALMMALAAGDPVRVGAALANDLWPAAYSLNPSLQTTLAAGRAAGAIGAIVSGSGPTVALLASDAAAATDLAVELSTREVAHEVRVVTGPVPGATVLPG